MQIVQNAAEVLQKNSLNVKIGGKTSPETPEQEADAVMKRNELLLEAKITPEVFREFAFFDTMGRQGRWRAPALFAGILLAAACVCFTQWGRIRGAGLLGGVLAGVGLVLPAGYFLSFFLSVRAQEKRLKGAPSAYTLRLSEGGVSVLLGKERREYAWGDVLRACRLRRSVCLYVEENRAYILPAGSGRASLEAVWDRVCGYVPEGRREARGRRMRRRQ